jgi:hypothetical protein
VIERVARSRDGFIKMQATARLAQDEPGTVTTSLALRSFGVVRQVKALPIFSSPVLDVMCCRFGNALAPAKVLNMAMLL